MNNRNRRARMIKIGIPEWWKMPRCPRCLRIIWPNQEKGLCTLSFHIQCHWDFVLDQIAEARERAIEWPGDLGPNMALLIHNALITEARELRNYYGDRIEARRGLFPLMTSEDYRGTTYDKDKTEI
jgi:hypothetical protein